jgi:hypothetical protein
MEMAHRRLRSETLAATSLRLHFAWAEYLSTATARPVRVGAPVAALGALVVVGIGGEPTGSAAPFLAALRTFGLHGDGTSDAFCDGCQ